MKRMLELGDKTEYYVSKDYGYTSVYADNQHEKSFRINPILVQAVEELGENASGRYAKLAVIEIPFEDENGWKIDEYDGYEKIEEEHRSWY